MNERQNLIFYENPKKNIILGEGIGKVTPDDLRWMIADLMRRGKEAGGQWAWIAIISRMDPIIDPESQKVFAELHHQLESAGCKAIAYVVGGTAAIKVQAQRHRLQANDNLVAGYFKTKEDALEWLADIGI